MTYGRRCFNGGMGRGEAIGALKLLGRVSHGGVEGYSYM